MNELERVEAQAVREAVVLGGGRGELVGGAVCVSQPRLPIMELNRALPIGSVVDLDAIAAWFDGPHTVAATEKQLQRELGRRGYQPSRAWMKFERGNAPAPHVESEFRVAKTLDSPLLGELMTGDPGSPLGAMVGAPGWHCFLAWAGDTAAATGSLYVDGTTAWLGIGFTRPEFRRRGAQSALLSARIELARHLGATQMTTETGDLQPGKPASSYNNILRAGFRESYTRSNWIAPA